MNTRLLLLFALLGLCACEPQDVYLEEIKGEWVLKQISYERKSPSGTVDSIASINQPMGEFYFEGCDKKDPFCDAAAVYTSADGKQECNLLAVTVAKGKKNNRTATININDAIGSNCFRTQLKQYHPAMQELIGSASFEGNAMVWTIPGYMIIAGQTHPSVTKYILERP